LIKSASPCPAPPRPSTSPRSRASTWRSSTRTSPSTASPLPEPTSSASSALPRPVFHQMIVQLERVGLIRHTPRQARSIELLFPAEELPALQPIRTSVVGLLAGGVSCKRSS
jgi:hypothetical protein